MRKGPTGVGYTFERLIGKKEDNRQEPDYKGIEIKTMKYFSSQIIHLFSINPDGDTSLALKNVINQLGYPDKDYPQYKVLSVSLKANEYTKLAYKRIKIEVNRKKEKIELVAYNTYGKIYKLDTSWSFKTIENVYNQKMKELAIIKACSKKINNEDYFLYTRIDFYKKKSFQKLLELMENGTISITFNISIHKDKENLGKEYNHGTHFAIKEKDIPLLFNSSNK